MFSDIIWDFDGTLFDTYPAITNSFQRALIEEGIEQTEEEILKQVKISVTHGINYYRDNFKINVKSFVDRYNKYEDEVDETKIFPFPYAVEICSEIIDRGGRNYIITHRDKSIYKFLKHHNMISLFTEVVTEEHGFKRKPDPEAYVYLLNKYHIDTKNALMIGDRELDLTGAKNAGIKACLFDVCDCDFRHLADYVIGFMKELEKLIFE